MNISAVLGISAAALWLNTSLAMVSAIGFWASWHVVLGIGELLRARRARRKDQGGQS